MSSPVDPKYKTLSERVELFNGLSPSDVAKIFQRGMTMRVGKGDPIFYKDTTGSQMFVVLGGKVGVFDGKQCVAELPVGAMFGEMSLLCDEPRSATVTALEDSSLFVLSEEIFHKLLTKRVAVQILLNIARTMSKRVLSANKTIRETQSD